MNVVIGTAGHIDHGKTALLRALTGIDADRLPEERRRGMTIDVGYAHLDLPDGRSVDFVDVPGHDRLIGNMLVGAGEIDAALLVVAADDGPRAQTLEHLELLDGLAIRDGFVVVSKADLVPGDRLEAVTAAIRGLVDGTSLAGAPILQASSVTGAGLGAVREAVLDVAERVSRRAASVSLPRLAVDRVFAARGRGTVVTGTLQGGSLRAGDVLDVVPGGGSVRIREVQVHGRQVAEAGAGRVALNLAGITAGTIRRGVVLTTDPRVVPSDRLLVAMVPVAALGGRPARLPHDRARLRLHVGTDQVAAVLGRSGSLSVALPTGEATSVLRLERPVAVAPGDRFVLRRPSPGRTEAGGRVLDPRVPAGPSRRRATAARLERLAAAAGGADESAARLELHGASGTGAAVTLAADVWKALEALVLEVVADHRASHSESGGIPSATLAGAVARALRRLVTVEPPDAAHAAGDVIQRLLDGRLARTGDLVHQPGGGPAGPSAALQAAMDRLEQTLDVPAPPALREAARAAGCPPEGMRLLELTGRIVRVDEDIAWSWTAWRRLADTALRLAAERPLAPATLRDATGTSRKYVMALLEDLGRRAILTRTEAGHMPGPRAATLDAAAPADAASLRPVAAGRSRD